jgi:sigma-B regulation protein RsbU (phosphoserine phosphatase)
MSIEENIIRLHNGSDELSGLRARVDELESQLSAMQLECAAKDALIAELRDELAAANNDDEVRKALQLLEAANMELTRANRSMREHLRAASKVQQSLLPERMPAAERVRFAWRYRPCEGLAGDILNIFRLDDTHVGLYVLDVAGHGAAAALHAVSISRLLVPMSLRSSWVREWEPYRGEYYVVPPGEVVDRLNRHFPWDEERAQFFTLVYGVLNKSTLELRYCVAGHPGPAHLPKRGEPKIMTGTGLPVGLMPRAYDEQSLQLAPGDRLYLYSDGITEARNAAGQLFGSKAMLEVLGSAPSVESSLDSLLAQLEDWRGDTRFEDDLSLLALEVALTK